MDARETCAVCGKAGTPGTVECFGPYPAVARANEWPHDWAHLDCARYKARTISVDGPRPKW